MERHEMWFLLSNKAVLVDSKGVENDSWICKGRDMDFVED